MTGNNVSLQQPDNSMRNVLLVLAALAFVWYVVLPMLKSATAKATAAVAAAKVACDKAKTSKLPADIAAAETAFAEADTLLKAAALDEKTKGLTEPSPEFLKAKADLALVACAKKASIGGGVVAANTLGESLSPATNTSAGGVNNTSAGGSAATAANTSGTAAGTGTATASNTVTTGTTTTTPPATTAAGGTTTTNNPVATAPVTGAPTIGGTTGNVVVSKVSSIQISKNSAGKSKPATGEDDYWKTFQIGEIVVYDLAGNKLPRSAYASASYNMSTIHTMQYPATNVLDGSPNLMAHTGGFDDVHTLTVNLVEPTVISKVEVYNRQDCCQWRLDGAVAKLLDASGNLLKSVPLNSGLVQTITW